MRTSRSLVEKPKAGKVLEMWLQNSWCLSFLDITCNFLSYFECLWPISAAAALAYLKIVMVLWLFVTKIYSFQLLFQCQILYIAHLSVMGVYSESESLVMEILWVFYGLWIISSFCFWNESHMHIFEIIKYLSYYSWPRAVANVIKQLKVLHVFTHSFLQYLILTELCFFFSFFFPPKLYLQFKLVF